jgi:hypothetical protein
VPGASLPPSYADHWDAAHVKLPCSPRNVAKGGVAGGRWPVIVQTLSSPLPTYDALEQALVAGQSPPHRARPTTPRGLHALSTQRPRRYSVATTGARGLGAGGSVCRKRR